MYRLQAALGAVPRNRLVAQHMTTSFQHDEEDYFTCAGPCHLPHGEVSSRHLPGAIFEVSGIPCAASPFRTTSTCRDQTFGHDNKKGAWGGGRNIGNTNTYANTYAHRRRESVGQRLRENHEILGNPVNAGGENVELRRLESTIKARDRTKKGN